MPERVQNIENESFQSVFEQFLAKEFCAGTENGSAVRVPFESSFAANVLNNIPLTQANAYDTIEAIIAELDKRLCAQLNLIIHQPEFQSLESVWRGIDYLVRNTEISAQLKIRIYNISKKELARTQKKHKGVTWDQSPIFKRLYEDGYDTAGGEPFGCIIGDYYFNHSIPDVEILRSIAMIASAAHTPFISSVDPSILNMESWQELANPRDLRMIFNTPEYQTWRSFRDSDDSRYVALTLPRVRARSLYEISNNPWNGICFEETTGAGDHNKCLWMNSAYAMAVNINRSFALYGWCAKIRGVDSGGIVTGLPQSFFAGECGKTAGKCPTEVAITPQREAELSYNGFLPLCYWKNSDYAVFLGSQTVNKPKEYSDPNATINAAFSARLPYIFATCRFAHFLKCIVREKIGSFKGWRDMQDMLSEWISHYVTGDPDASEEIKAKYPLSEAKIVIKPIENQPGYYNARLYLRPHYQLEGLTTSLCLVSRIQTGY